MDISFFRAQLEEELTWRVEEIRFFANACERLNLEEEQDRFRRASILLLYSHFEGYCKFALVLYVSALNSIGLQCSDANSAIVATSLHNIFKKLRDSSVKSPIFRNELPEDSKLHKFALDREFVERSAELMASIIIIPDDAVDTESNLKPVVLRKNLYKLGLPFEEFTVLDADINKLLELRNKIAHGATKNGIDRGLYEGLRDSALRVMNGITSGVTRALTERWYLA